MECCRQLELFKEAGTTLNKYVISNNIREGKCNNKKEVKVQTDERRCEYM